MAKKRQLVFYIDNELWKEFSKKCIGLDKSKTRVIEELIERFVKK